MYQCYPLGDSPTSPVPSSTAPDGKKEPGDPAVVPDGTPSTSSVPLMHNGGLWGGVIGSIFLFALPIAVAIIKRRKRHDTAGKDRLNNQQRRPLMGKYLVYPLSLIPLSLSPTGDGCISVMPSLLNS